MFFPRRRRDRPAAHHRRQRRGRSSASIADVVDRRLDVPRGAFAYVPSAFNLSQISVIVRTPLDPMSLVASVRAEVARLDPGVAVASPRALDRAMAESMTQRKVVLALVGDVRGRGAAAGRASASTA